MEREAAPECNPGRQRLLDRIFELTLDALPDGVLVVDSERRVMFANAAFLRHWKLPSGMGMRWDEPAMLEHASSQLVDPGTFLRGVESLYPSHAEPNDELQFKDGRVFERRSVPLISEDEFEARIWIFTDVTAARQALVDPLSGVPNRLAFSREFPRLAESTCDGLLKCIAILDIDNFKAYNDRYGHAAGDDVLRQVGALLKAKLGQSDDYIFRIGGEEFLLGFRARKENEALAIADGVRRAIEEAGIRHQGNAPHDVVTASIGIVTFRGARRPEEIFDHADVALYRAKSEGRNRVSQTTKRQPPEGRAE